MQVSVVEGDITVEAVRFVAFGTDAVDAFETTLRQVGRSRAD